MKEKGSGGGYCCRVDARQGGKTKFSVKGARIARDTAHLTPISQSDR